MKEIMKFNSKVVPEKREYSCESCKGDGIESLDEDGAITWCKDCDGSGLIQDDNE